MSSIDVCNRIFLFYLFFPLNLMVHISLFFINSLSLLTLEHLILVHFLATSLTALQVTDVRGRSRQAKSAYSHLPWFGCKPSSSHSPWYSRTLAKSGSFIERSRVNRGSSLEFPQQMFCHFSSSLAFGWNNKNYFYFKFSDFFQVDMQL